MLTRPQSQAMWRSEERLYLTADGRVVKQGDPAASSLLVAAGGDIPLERAQSLGLAGGKAFAGDPVAETQDASESLRSQISELETTNAELLSDLEAIRITFGLQEGVDLVAEINRLAAASQPAAGLETSPETSPGDFDIPGLNPKAKASLQAAGLWSIDALKAANDHDLIKLEDVGQAAVKIIRASLGA